MRRPLTLLTIVVVALLWSSALVAAPVLDAPRASALVYAAGSVVCHQLPNRSFHLADTQLPVCARCLGLYLGGCAGLIAWGVLAGVRHPTRRAHAWLSTRRLRPIIVLAAAPTLVTVFTAWSGLWDPGNLIRAALALPLGAIGAVLVAAFAAGDLR